ncbi:hypothetical protein BV22DRAFT_205687 [Leucogyrophana mollusca]|uniref:Uncharacterized protein n=1 Tax=Leucogyrophana mollusca TaxID=85980 RepID=A0ACB8BU75_9AGAM|nr:hypothetical protein BV22DRAFT_205687 [Leucogyrophana mollusca]
MILLNFIQPVHSLPCLQLAKLVWQPIFLRSPPQSLLSPLFERPPSQTPICATTQETLLLTGFFIIHGCLMWLDVAVHSELDRILLTDHCSPLPVMIRSFGSALLGCLTPYFPSALSCMSKGVFVHRGIRGVHGIVDCLVRSNSLHEIVGHIPGQDHVTSSFLPHAMHAP